MKQKESDHLIHTDALTALLERYRQSEERLFIATASACADFLRWRSYSAERLLQELWLGHARIDEVNRFQKTMFDVDKELSDIDVLRAFHRLFGESVVSATFFTYAEILAIGTSVPQTEPLHSWPSGYMFQELQRFQSRASEWMKTASAPISSALPPDLELPDLSHFDHAHVSRIRDAITKVADTAAIAIAKNVATVQAVTPAANDAFLSPPSKRRPGRKPDSRLMERNHLIASIALAYLISKFDPGSVERYAGALDERGLKPRKNWPGSPKTYVEAVSGAARRHVIDERRNALNHQPTALAARRKNACSS